MKEWAQVTVAGIAGIAKLLDVQVVGVLAALLQHARPMKASGWRRVLRPAGIFAATLFGVFSKENAVAVAAVKNAAIGFFQISSAISHASSTFARWSARLTTWYPLARSRLPINT